MTPVLINQRWTLLLPDHRCAQWVNDWERARLDAMAAVIRPGDVVYDIGGEEMDMSALFASWGADVVIVEPNPPVWPNGRAIFEANDLTDRMRGWFVGFASDSIRLRSDWDTEHVGDGGTWPACAYGPVIDDHGFMVVSERPECPCTTVDQLAESYGPPTVLTMDVEGAEFLVLQGAYRTLLEHRPVTYVSEHLDLPWLDEKFGGDTGPRVAEYMASLGYERRVLATSHERHVEYRHPEGR